MTFILEPAPAGHGDWVQSVPQVTDAAVSPGAKPAGCLEWWAKNKEKWLLPDN